MTNSPATVLHGDCLEVLRTLPDCSVDAVVTDPPYELSFMNRSWDATGIAYNVDLWRQCQRVLKPGGHLLAFGGTRTFHRLACAIEDAGFEIRDSIGDGHAVPVAAWVYGSGFPKSLDVGKAIDRQRNDRADVETVRRFLESARVAAGMSRRDVAQAFDVDTRMVQKWMGDRDDPQAHCPTWEQWLRLRDVLSLSDEMDAEVWRLNGRKGTPGEAWERREVVGTRRRLATGREGYGFGEDFADTVAATDDARRWQGFGTALKPAWEPIVMARRPLEGTVAANVLEWGTGAINIDATRVAMSDPDRQRLTEWHGRYGGRDYAESGVASGKGLGAIQPPHTAGRWPANVVFSHHGYALYALRHDVPDSVAQTIRAYYGHNEAVREVRGGDPGDALGTGEASLLLTGMREPRASGCAGQAVGHDDVQGLPEGVRGNARLGEGWPAPILHSGLPDEGSPRQHRPDWQAPHAGSASENGGQSPRGREVVAVEGRPVREPGLHPRHDLHASGGHAGAGTADQPEGEVHPGAPRGRGGATGPANHPGRGRASRERDQDGQPSGELGRGAEGGPLGGAPGDRTEVPDVAGGAGAVAGGERRLEVPASEVPRGWLKYFEYVGESASCNGACVPGCPVAELDQQSGPRPTGAVAPYTYGGSSERIYGGGRGYLQAGQVATYAKEADFGGASRFFPVFRYQAKAPASERPRVMAEGGDAGVGYVAHPT